MVTIADVPAICLVLAIAALIIIRRVKPIGNTDLAKSSTTYPTTAKQIERGRDGDGYLDIFPLLDDILEPEDAQAKEQMVKDKELYWKLQNVEDHPGICAPARDRLLQLFDHTLSATSRLDPSSIMSIPTYSSTALRELLSTAHSNGAGQYTAYLHRRQSGGPRELFPTGHYAHQWLRLAACVKYVDGSWVSGILLRLSSVNRQSAKMAWQVISEEFGDGHLEKNHVYIYHHLIDSLGVGGRDEHGRALRGDVRGFDGLREEQGIPRCWSAAVAQQCIGLLAPEFFPESLGFNMAYETLPYHLLVTSYELRELGIDDSYFALHITIDNPHSGHAAMARLAVETYLESLQGEEQHMAWKRVQAGMVLAEGLPTTPWSPIELECVDTRFRPKMIASPPMPSEFKVAELFLNKSTAGRGMHCPSRLCIRGMSLEDWLDPATITLSKSTDFVRALSAFRPLVVKGQAGKSRLVKEMEWGGRMFGAFSNSEVAAVRRWINDLDTQPVNPGSYTAFTGARHHQSLLAHPHLDLGSHLSTICNATMQPDAGKKIDMATIWYASLLLLDHFALSPPQLATPFGMSILRVLRAQLGFPALHRRVDICAGLDDYQDGRYPTGLWEIGEQIFGRSFDEDGIIEAMPRTLRDLMNLRYHPYANSSLLVGLSLGFLGLHRHRAFIARMERLDVSILERIEAEQRRALHKCIEEHQKENDNEWRFNMIRGYNWAQRILGNIETNPIIGSGIKQ